MRKHFAIALIFSALFCGCTTPNNLSISKDNKIDASTGTMSVAKMDVDGNITAAYNGVAPAQGMMDDKGVWYNTPGAGALLVFDPVSGKVMSMSPKDTIITGVKVTPNPAVGQPSFEAQSINTNISNVAKVYADQFAAGVEATRGMSEAEAKARVDAMVHAGDITSDIAAVLLKALYPAVDTSATE